MRKTIAIICLLVSGRCYTQNATSFTLPSLTGGTIGLGNYTGKKVLLVGIDLTNDTLPAFIRLDSAYAGRSASLEIIGVPLKELSGRDADSSRVQVWWQTTLFPYPLTRPIYGSKSSELLQHPLAKWLTYSSQNGRFNVDWTEHGQMFLLNEHGELYGIFKRSTPLVVLTSALNKTFPVTPN